MSEMKGHDYEDAEGRQKRMPNLSSEMIASLTSLYYTHDVDNVLFSPARYIKTYHNFCEHTRRGC